MSDQVLARTMPMDDDAKRRIWQRLEVRMTDWCESWRDRVNETAVRPHVVSRRRSGVPFSNEEVFKGLILAILSNQTDWRSIQKLNAMELSTRFDHFDVRKYAEKTDVALEELTSWFKDKKAGSQTRRNDLRRLRDTARKLVLFAETGLDSYLQQCIQEKGGKPERAVFAFGRDSPWKLQGFGPALSAEALRNLGYDIAKPDRHVLRAVGQWNLVEFRRWPDRSNRRAPEPTDDELLLGMEAISGLAKAINETVTFTDSVIWTACAKGGAWLTNQELNEIGRGRH